MPILFFSIYKVHDELFLLQSKLTFVILGLQDLRLALHILSF